MNRNTQRLAIFSTKGIILLTVLMVIVIIIPVIKGPTGWHTWTPAKTCYYVVDTSIVTLTEFCGFIYFIQTPLILILFACLFEYASGSQKIFSGISLCFTVLFAALIIVSYIALLTIKGMYNHHCNHDDLLYAKSLFQYFATSSYVMSITIFLGLAELFIIPVFVKTNPAERLIRLILFIAGIVNLMGALMYIFDISGIFEFCLVLSQISFIAVVFLFKRFFSQFGF